MPDSFYNKIYRAVQRIPRGMVATYGQVAAMAGNGGAARAVGNALHINPAPGVIPCHRVIGTDGSLTGYAGGLERKMQLLALEQVDLSVFPVPRKQKTRSTAE